MFTYIIIHIIHIPDHIPRISTGTSPPSNLLPGSARPVASVEPPPIHRPRCSQGPPRSAHAWTWDMRPATDTSRVSHGFPSRRDHATTVM